ncbi:hypothetical protein TEA_006823 [Camellia sinensis var. sinensis]|uniref:Uncharacterized protein n=1 Tax=Camellia sinensis var. sinensis TaxID=542762 RepID=A0A4S4ELE3_CAMSN|nr:hypothetical protein TEA_006823 [Camellia sinensis var. sinensis]
MFPGKIELSYLDGLAFICFGVSAPMLLRHYLCSSQSLRECLIKYDLSLHLTPDHGANRSTKWLETIVEDVYKRTEAAQSGDADVICSVAKGIHRFVKGDPGNGDLGIVTHFIKVAEDIGIAFPPATIDTSATSAFATIANPHAAELLRHSHLQPYVLKVQLKLNSPRRNSLSTHWHETEYMKKTKFIEPEDIPVSMYKEKRHSYGNDRTLNPSISGAAEDSSFSQRNQRIPRYVNQRIEEMSVGSTHEVTTFARKFIPKASNTGKTTRLTPEKASAPPKKQAELSKNRESFSDSRMPTKKIGNSNRRASFPLPVRTIAQGSPCKPYVGILDCIKSPDVSVNEPRIDRMAEFPLASYDDPFTPIRRTSSNSAQGSSTSPQVDRSIMKDKCMVQVCDRNFRRLSFADSWQRVEGTMKLDGEDGSECSGQNATAGASSQTSSDLRRRRFDPSSYQQRADALEGLLEFSARLLHEERYDELGVLLKPFGPGKVSPRETAIWLTKSFKENTLKQEDQHQ